MCDTPSGKVDLGSVLSAGLLAGGASHGLGATDGLLTVRCAHGFQHPEQRQDAGL